MSELAHITDLLKQLRDDTTTLVREEVALAKTETAEKAAYVGRNAAFLGAGALVGYSALLMILMAIGFLLRDLFVERGMSEGTATCLGLLIVGVVVGVISAVLISKAISAFKQESIAPQRTIGTLREDKEWVQSKVS